MEEHYFFDIELLYEFVDDTYSDLFSADFPSLSNFDDTYYCNSCTDTNLCFVCTEIEVALRVEIFTTDETIYAAEALDIPVAPTKPSIKQQPSLDPKSLPRHLYYSSKLEFEKEEKLLQEHKKGIG